MQSYCKPHNANTVLLPNKIKTWKLYWLTSNPQEIGFKRVTTHQFQLFWNSRRCNSTKLGSASPKRQLYDKYSCRKSNSWFGFTRVSWSSLWKSYADEYNTAILTSLRIMLLYLWCRIIILWICSHRMDMRFVTSLRNGKIYFFTVAVLLFIFCRSWINKRILIFRSMDLLHKLSENYLSLYLQCCLASADLVHLWPRVSVNSGLGDD